MGLLQIELQIRWQKLCYYRSLICPKQANEAKEPALIFCFSIYALLTIPGEITVPKDTREFGDGDIHDTTEVSCSMRWEYGFLILLELGFFLR